MGPGGSASLRGSQGLSGPYQGRLATQKEEDSLSHIPFLGGNLFPYRDKVHGTRAVTLGTSLLMPLLNCQRLAGPEGFGAIAEEV